MPQAAKSMEEVCVTERISQWCKDLCLRNCVPRTMHEEFLKPWLILGFSGEVQLERRVVNVYLTLGHGVQYVSGCMAGARSSRRIANGRQGSSLSEGSAHVWQNF